MSEEPGCEADYSCVTQESSRKELLNSLIARKGVKRVYLAHKKLKDLGPNYKVIAESTGLNFDEVRWLDIVCLNRLSSSPDGRGRLELRPYIIATKYVSNEWPDVSKYRDLYDKGMIDMFTGRDGNTLILYAKRRRHPDYHRLPYFSEET